MDEKKLKNLIKDALAEDIGKIDLTTSFLVPQNRVARSGVTAKSDCVVAGLSVFKAVYNELDEELRIKFNLREGGEAEAGKVICYVEGRASSILKGERVALNLLSTVSGIATITKKYVDKISSYKAEILDTRKTDPNMRFLEKYAVRMGGGKNHRMGLYDQVLIKENHLTILRELRGPHAPVIEEAVKAAKKKAQRNVLVEVEVTSVAEFEEALGAGADIIMCDNMDPATIREAVKVRNAGGSKSKKVLIEVSGNITLQNIETYAATGVDRISIGAITHSSPSVDFSLTII